MKDARELVESIELAQRARAGDSSAVDTLLQRYQHRLRRVVRVRLGARLRSKLDSMDIVQETLIVAARKLEATELASSAAILNWLARIAENKIHDAHDYFTARVRDMAREERERIIVSGESVGWDPPARGDTPSVVAEKEELVEIVDDAVAELSDDHREVLVLRNYLGAEWGEVASHLQRSVAAAQELHRRARERLQELVRPRLGRDV